MLDLWLSLALPTADPICLSIHLTLHAYLGAQFVQYITLICHGVAKDLGPLQLCEGHDV